jgi:hypothetical protein
MSFTNPSEDKNSDEKQSYYPFFFEKPTAIVTISWL